MRRESDEKIIELIELTWPVNRIFVNWPLINHGDLRRSRPVLIRSCSPGCFFQMFDDIIFAFFSLEMTIKMVAMGIYGKGTYLADSWNRLDFFIVIAG